MSLPHIATHTTRRNPAKARCPYVGAEKHRVHCIEEFLFGLHLRLSISIPGGVQRVPAPVQLGPQVYPATHQPLHATAGFRSVNKVTQSIQGLPIKQMPAVIREEVCLLWVHVLSCHALTILHATMGTRTFFFFRLLKQIQVFRLFFAHTSPVSLSLSVLSTHRGECRVPQHTKQTRPGPPRQNKSHEIVLLNLVKKTAAKQ